MNAQYIEFVDLTALHKRIQYVKSLCAIYVFTKLQKNYAIDTYFQILLPLLNTAFTEPFLQVCR